jgi:hypothetical protein
LAGTLHSQPNKTPFIAFVFYTTISYISITIMNNIAIFLVLVLTAANLVASSTAFATTSSFATLRKCDVSFRSSCDPAVLVPTFRGIPSPSSSSSFSNSALQLKVKVDPDAKKTKNTAGNAKMAAYGGSVIIAVLLPIAFLVWSAVSK